MSPESGNEHRRNKEAGNRQARMGEPQRKEAPKPSKTLCCNQCGWGDFAMLRAAARLPVRRARLPPVALAVGAEVLRKRGGNGER